MFERSFPFNRPALPQIASEGASPIGELLSELLSRYHLAEDGGAATAKPRTATIAPRYFSAPRMAALEPSRT